MKTNEKRFYMEAALNFSKLSKCAAKKVACLLVKDNNIVSYGLNGTFPNTTNCNDIFKKENGIWYKKDLKTNTFIKCNKNEHHEWSLINENHAEMNALAKLKGDANNCSAFVTHSPCFNCAKVMAFFGIKEIYYYHEYDDVEVVKEFLKDKVIINKISL